MTITSTQFHIDRTLDLDTLSAGIARVFGLGQDLVAAANFDDMSQVVDGWFGPDKAIAIQTETLRGDFPLQVTVTSRNDRDFEAFTRALAQALGVAIVTDEFGVNPYSDVEWSMITPDGAVTRVLANEDEFGAEDPAIILRQEYRRLYDARSTHVAAAD